MQKVRFASQSSRRGDHPAVTSERLINCYIEKAPAGARSEYVVRSVLGYKPTAFADLDNKIVRAAKKVGGVLFVVASGALYEVDSGGTATNRGAITDDVDTVISENNGDVTIAAGNTYYVWNGSTLTTPGSGRITNEGSVAYLDGYTIISENGGIEFEWTDILDASTRNATYFASKEGRQDNVLRVLASQGNIWVMGGKSRELFYNTGGSGADAFARVSGAVIDRGLKRRTLCIEYEGAVFYVGNDNVFYVGQGVSDNPISTSAVDYALEQEEPTDVFIYEDRGHKFVCIRFAERPAWCFDLLTGAWHERATGTSFDAWEIVDTVFAYGKWLAINRLGVIYEMDRTNKDGATPLRRTMVSLPLDLAGRRYRVPLLEIRGQPGFADIGRDISVMLRLSRDGGATWGLEKVAKFGALGEYGSLARFRGLGMARSLTAEVSVSDPAEIPLESDAVVEVV